MKLLDWPNSALRDLRRLDPPVARAVLQALELLARTGQGDVTRLKAQGHTMRLRVGDWRVQYLAISPNMIRVLRIRHRSEAYR
ncbi:MAG: type II toxin-antitoxin system RelE/ParE family toxin [Acidobacteria bacterium]|nr:type II toxin-antitoxin system RelE/ParE family toxin [Acidobacteriota bacterium]